MTTHDLLRLTVLVFVSLGMSTLSATEADEFVAAKSVTEFESRLTSILTENKTPGLIGAIVSDKELIWQGALGLADIESEQPVTQQSLFRVGSISKTFVSLAILKLVEQGQLSLDQSVQDLVPEAGIVNPWHSSDPVKLVHLLEHTAGFDDIHVRDFAFSDPEVTTLDGIEFNQGSRDVRWRPGSRVSYSNMGPPVAALVLEKVTGKTFETFADEAILSTLGMTGASFYFDEKVVSSYAYDGKTVAPYVHIPVRPSGALNASSDDMIQLLRMFIGRGELDGRRILQESSITRMETPESSLAARNGLQAGYGLSNMYIQSDGFVFHGHDGGIDGFLSAYAYLPGPGLGYFFSINAANGMAFSAIDDEFTAFLTSALEKPEPVTVITDPVFDTSYIGFYQPDSPRMEMTRGLEKLLGMARVDFERGRMIFSPVFGEPTELLPVASHSFIKTGDALPSLMMLESQQGEKLLQGRGGTARQVPEAVAYLSIGLLVYVGLMMASSVIFAPIWVFGRLIGRPAKINHLWVRLLPLLTIICLLGSIACLLAGDTSDLGTFSTISVAYWVLSIFWALLSFVSLAQVILYRHRRLETGSWVWSHSLMVSTALVIAAVYLSYYGIIGARLWAY